MKNWQEIIPPVPDEEWDAVVRVPFSGTIGTNTFEDCTFVVPLPYIEWKAPDED